MALISKLTAIADAIRARTGGTEAITLADMPDQIAAIEGGDGGEDTTWLYIADGSYEGELSNDEIESLRHYAFYGCTGITGASFPAVISFSAYAFYGCTSLAAADFPLVTSIGASAFWGCTSLAAADFPLATSIGSYTFRGCTALTAIELPVASGIPTYCFYGCTTLSKVDLGSATSISTYAFYGCTRFTTLIIRTDNVCTLAAATTTFQNTALYNGGGYIYVPSELVEEYQAATNWATYADQFRAIEDYPDICGTDEDTDTDTEEE